MQTTCREKRFGRVDMIRNRYAGGAIVYAPKGNRIRKPDLTATAYRPCGRMPRSPNESISRDAYV